MKGFVDLGDGRAFIAVDSIATFHESRDFESRENGKAVITTKDGKRLVSTCWYHEFVKRLDEAGGDA